MAPQEIARKARDKDRMGWIQERDKLVQDARDSYAAKISDLGVADSTEQLAHITRLHAERGKTIARLKLYYDKLIVAAGRHGRHKLDKQDQKEETRKRKAHHALNGPEPTSVAKRRGDTAKMLTGARAPPRQQAPTAAMEYQPQQHKSKHATVQRSSYGAAPKRKKLPTADDNIDILDAELRSVLASELQASEQPASQEQQASQQQQASQLQASERQAPQQQASQQQEAPHQEPPHQQEAPPQQASQQHASPQQPSPQQPSPHMDMYSQPSPTVAEERRRHSALGVGGVVSTADLFGCEADDYNDDL